MCNELLQIKCRGLCGEALKCSDGVDREKLLLEVPCWSTFTTVSAHVGACSLAVCGGSRIHGCLLQACYSLLDALKHYKGYSIRIAYSTSRLLLAALTEHEAAYGALLCLSSQSQAHESV